MTTRKSKPKKRKPKVSFTRQWIKDEAAQLKRRVTMPAGFALSVYGDMVNWKDMDDCLVVGYHLGLDDGFSRGLKYAENQQLFGEKHKVKK